MVVNASGPGPGPDPDSRVAIDGTWINQKLCRCFCQLSEEIWARRVGHTQAELNVLGADWFDKSNLSCP